MKTRTTFTLSLTAILILAAGSALAYSGGSGTAGDPYQIATKADLLALAANMADYNKCFILTADINMGGQVFMTAIIAANPGQDYPFGGTAFTGTFDGKGHRIACFTINGGSNSYLGLFGQINSSGSVKNLGLEYFVVVSSSSYVGGLVGWNYSGSISNCYSTGTVSGTYFVGSLVGYNDSSISYCYSTGAVSGDSNAYSVGGLVGESGGGSISNCYSTGTVSGGSKSYYVGGLVGQNGGGSSISNCYSTGTVSGSNYVSGLVGMNYGSISVCYSTGAVSGFYRVGGLVGWSFSGSISSSFWDTNTSGQTISSGGTGMTTAQMKTLSTFTSAGWNFTTIWAICEGTNYPRLIWQIPAADWVCPDGVNFADFAYFAERWQTTGCNSSNNFCGGTDMNGSGTVDMQDFAMFAENWLSGE
ncbi:MAG: GLUG motif-containing protein [Sedimentisphaerales bacterium]|jgi:hypothetical protein